MTNEKQKGLSSKAKTVLGFAITAVVLIAAVLTVIYIRAPKLPYRFDKTVFGRVYKIDPSMIESVNACLYDGTEYRLTDEEIKEFASLYNKSKLKHKAGVTTSDYGISVNFTDGSHLGLTDVSSDVYLHATFRDKDGNIYGQKDDIKISNPKLLLYLKGLCGYPVE